MSAVDGTKRTDISREVVMKIAIVTTSLGIVIASCVALAEPPGRPGCTLAQVTVVPAPMTRGEIRKVDRDAGKITIRHGPIINLEMPAMTMVFRVKDLAMLDQMKEGDKVKFVARRENGAITIVELQRDE